MGININQSIDAHFFERWITVGKLKEVLRGLDDNLELLPNRVGNLNVFSTDHEFKGVIDFNEEMFEAVSPSDFLSSKNLK